MSSSKRPIDRKSASGGVSSSGQAASSAGTGIYPLWHSQVCDHCKERDHEAQNCKSTENGTAGLHCKTCGHGDHVWKQCPLIKMSKKWQKPEQVTADIYDQFTPLFRAKYAPQEPATPVHRGGPPGSVTSPSKTPKTAGSSSASKGNPSSQGQSQENEEEDPRAAQMKLWALAEKQLPTLPANTSRESADKNSAVIKTNFFEIKLDASVGLLKYSITIEQQKPPRTGTQLGKNDKKDTRKIKRETKRFLIEDYLRRNPPPHSDWATDWNSTIISRGPIYSGGKLGLVLQAPSSNSSIGNSTNSNRPARLPLMTSVQLVGKVDLAGLKNHVKGKGKKSMDNAGEVLNALNIVSWKDITKPGSEIGRAGNKFYPKGQWKKGEESRDSRKKEAYFLRDGFFTSMRPGQDSLLVNVNTVTTAFLSPINLQEWIETAFGLPYNPDDGRRPPPPQTGAFKLKLKTIRVTLDLHQNSRLWIICDISDKKIAELEFEKDDKSKEKVVTYLKRKYQAYRPDAKGLESYCINVGSAGKEIWYPADKLTIVDWQVARESVKKASGVQMVNAATRKPQANKNKIMDEGLRVLGLKPLEPFYKKFGMTPIATMVEVKAPILSPPKLKMGTKQAAPRVEEGEWRIAGQNQFFERAKTCEKLFVIRFDKVNTKKEIDYEIAKGVSERALRERNRQQALDGLTALKQALVDYGIVGQTISIVREDPTMPDRKPKNTFRDRCSKMLNDAAKQFGIRSTVKFILVVLEQRDIPFYGEVKRWGDCDFGVPTVCVTAAKIQKATSDPKLMANICLKINFKLKGVGHSLNPVNSSVGMTGATLGTMIVGADVTHPSKGLDKCPSMAGVVATDDETSSRYLGSARLQKGKQEYIEDLQGMMEERLKAWVEHGRNAKIKPLGKKLLPSRILFYRDGVSESQYGMVLHEEKPQILRACEKVLNYYMKGNQAPIPKNTKWVPNLTLIVVTKRHHSRFYPLKDLPNHEVNGPNDVNLPCGTVVDTKVITPNHWSFYLQSHTSELGTARTAHYVVVYDDAKYEPRKLQEITNNICYTSARATRAVSVCTPARYADLLCDRLRCYMRPVLDGSYTVPAPSDAAPAPPATESPKAAAPATAPADNGNDDDKLAYIQHTRVDPNVWKKSSTDPVEAARKNPWLPGLDGCMFYL